MEYYIEIKDQQNLTDPLILHFAEDDSISLKWLGGDDKTQTIIGSELNFSLLVDDCEEGKYDAYFTTDEQRWLVELRQTSDDELIWKGFLLPETYSEPYANKTFFVYFSAVDGLGLLKGKYLPDQYYEDELPVMDYIKAALMLTGLEYDIWFSAAIVNTNEKRWDKIYYDGLWNVSDNEKKKTAYEILEDLLYSMRCQLFQANDRWNIEGIQKMGVIENRYDVYEFDGGRGVAFWQKNVKELDFISYPNIDLIPPYKEITATHDREGLDFPDDLYQSDETEFNLNQYSFQNYYIPKGWQYENYRPLFYYDKENLFFSNESENANFDENRKFELRQRPYVQKGRRLKLNIAFKVKFNDPNIPPDEAKAQSWLNTVVYRVSIGGESIFFNHNSFYLNPESLSFSTSGIAEAEMIFEVKQSGPLNIEIFEPWGNIQSRGYSGAWLTELSLEDTTLEELDEYSHTAEIDENASKTQELELPVSQDLTALTPNFQLDYLRKEESGAWNVEGVIHRIFTDHGTKYYSVNLQTAKLIDQFPDLVFYETAGTGETIFNFNNSEVIFNYEDGDEFVVSGEQQNPSDIPTRFVIYTKKTRQPQIPRNEWAEWSNAFYGVEKKPYLQVAAEIEKELYEVPFLQIEGSCKNPIKINDVIRFRYKNQWRYLTVADPEWNIGENESNVLLQEAMYNGNSIGLIPPFVFAGEDKLVDNPGVVIPNADAFAFAINGTIDTYLWTQEAGATATIEDPNQLNPNIHNITGDGNVFKLTVTDSNGNTASDEMEINTRKTVSLDATIITDIQDSNQYNRVYQLGTTPSLSNGEAFEFFYDAHMDIFSVVSNNIRMRLSIFKNGLEIRREFLNIDSFFSGAEPINDDFKGSLIFREGDDITISFTLHDDSSIGGTTSNERVTINSIRMVDGYVEVGNLPVIMEKTLP